jgi:hypothetical protein
MTLVREGLERLNLDIGEFRDGLLSRPIDRAPYLRQLERAVEALEAKFERMSSPKPPLDPEEVWARWRTLGFDLSKLDRREMRTLAVSPKTAMRQKLVAAFTVSPDALKRWINLNGFVQAYFAQWRTMEEPQAVESLIQKMLGHGQIVRRSKILDLWRRSAFLFSPHASRGIGEAILRHRTPVKQFCSEFSIDPGSGLAVAAHEQAAALAVAALIQRDLRIGEDTALKELLWLSENLLTKALGDGGYRDAMSKLILSRMAEGMPRFQSALVSLVHGDERLGDPRLAYCAPHWRTMPAESKEKFLAWLAKDTLEFFFDTLVPRNDRNRRRAEFWLQYAKKRGKIKDFQVAVSEDDRPKIRASRAKTIPSYSTIPGGKASAFLMVFEGYGTDYVVIEFSETGHAAYIYKRKVFEASGASIRSNSFDMAEDLKRMDDAADRILHLVDTRERWEVKARRRLAELGIRP